ncbi:WapI family immunity protein [Domibacillus aminovorans]
MVHSDRVSLVTCYPSGYGAVLRFEFESDQSYLKDLIKELDAILAIFPVIGKP